jgi:hypothetical protein
LLKKPLQSNYKTKPLQNIHFFLTLYKENILYRLFESNITIGSETSGISYLFQWAKRASLSVFSSLGTCLSSSPLRITQALRPPLNPTPLPPRYILRIIAVFVFLTSAFCYHRPRKGSCNKEKQQGVCQAKKTHTKKKGRHHHCVPPGRNRD